MKNKRSQTEIMGLAILFVLMIFGLLIYLKFTSGEKKNPRDDYLQPKMASSVLNAMLKTSVACNTRGTDDTSDDIIYSITDLLKDCMDVNLHTITCPAYVWLDEFPDGLITNNNYPESCQVAEDMFKTMLKGSLDKYSIPYYLEVKTKDGNDIFNSKLNGKTKIFRGVGDGKFCTSSMRQREPAVQPFELSTDTLIIQLGICY